jgi:hypothetical protein
MIIFSKVRVTSDTTNIVGEGLMGGEPVSYEDFEGWKFFEDVLQECSGSSKVVCEVQTYGYGEGPDVFDAMPEEVAYMMKRIEMRLDFLKSRCELRRQPYKVSINWEPGELFSSYADLIEKV